VTAAVGEEPEVEVAPVWRCDFRVLPKMLPEAVFQEFLSVAFRNGSRNARKTLVL
jgi:hypothetical protein